MGIGQQEKLKSCTHVNTRTSHKIRPTKLVSGSSWPSTEYIAIAFSTRPTQVPPARFGQ